MRLLLCLALLLPCAAQAAGREENLATCLSGQYPSLCRHELLTAAQRKEVAAAERRANLATCLDGHYPSLCHQELLKGDEVQRVKEAEYAANLQTCLDGNYRSLCRHEILRTEHRAPVAAAAPAHREPPDRRLHLPYSVVALNSSPANLVRSSAAIIWACMAGCQTSHASNDAPPWIMRLRVSS